MRFSSFTIVAVGKLLEDMVPKITCEQFIIFIYITKKYYANKDSISI